MVLDFDVMGWETMVLTTVTKRLWRRIAVSAAIVGAVLAIGKTIPVPGIEPEALAATIRLCATGMGATLLHVEDFVCTAPPPHKQLGGQALLGVAAMLACLILSVRRLLARD